MTGRRTRIAAIALLTTVAVAAPAAAAGQDLRSPDARDLGAQPASATVDLRSPDAAQPFSGPDVDLRSPDAADPYSGVPVRVIASAPVVRRVDSGFDWKAAGVGAGVLCALVLLVLGGSAITRRRSPAMS